MKHLLLKENEVTQTVFKLSEIPLKRTNKGNKIASFSTLTNLWVKNGCLCTRPGFFAENEMVIYNGSYNNGETVFYDRCFESFNSEIKVLYAIVKKINPSELRVTPYSASESGYGRIFNPITLTGSGISIKNVVFLGGKSLLGYSNTFMVLVYTAGGTDYSEVYELNGSNFIAVPSAAFYKPTVLLNGLGSNASLVKETLKNFAAPQKFENKGMLGGMKAYFCPDGVSASFKLPYDNLTNYQGEKISCTINGVTFEISENSNNSSVETLNSEGVYVNINRSLGVLTFYSQNGTPYTPPFADTPNGLEVVFYKTDTSVFTAFFKNLKNHSLIGGRTYFPGTGNNKSNLYFSGINNCFYICEENCISVGDETDEIRCVCTQSRYLIIFKNRSMYRAAVTEKGVSVLNALTSVKAVLPQIPQFSVSTINSNIGCNCPDTVKFVSNRIFWANDDYTVYTLFGSNTYTDGNVYEISESIKDEFKKCDSRDFATAFAGEWQGYYILCIGNRIFIMDGRIASLRFLSNASDGNNDVFWYVWETPEGNKTQDILSTGRGFGFVFKKHYTGDVIYAVQCYDGNDRIFVSDMPFLRQRDILWSFNFSDGYLTDKAKSVKIYSGSTDIGNTGDVKLSFSGNGNETMLMLMANGKAKRETLKTEKFFLNGKIFNRVCITVSGIGNVAMENFKLNYSETGYLI